MLPTRMILRRHSLALMVNIVNRLQLRHLAQGDVPLDSIVQKEPLILILHQLVTSANRRGTLCLLSVCLALSPDTITSMVQKNATSARAAIHARVKELTTRCHARLDTTASSTILSRANSVQKVSGIRFMAILKRTYACHARKAEYAASKE